MQSYWSALLGLPGEIEWRIKSSLSIKNKKLLDTDTKYSSVYNDSKGNKGRVRLKS